MKGIKAPYGHHKFQENISYGLIDPVHEWTRRGDHFAANNCKRKSASKNRKAAATANASPRSPKARNSSLYLENGSLKKRLDPSLEHLPLAVPGNNTTPICQLHRFTASQLGKGTKIPDGARASVMRCFTCGVNLFLPYFSLFRKTADLEEAIINIM